MKNEFKNIVIKYTAGSKSNQEEKFNLTNNSEFSIGRESSNTINFDSGIDNTVSRKHAIIKFERENGLFKIEDLGSLNGVFINGERIKEQTYLKVGDEVQLGLKGPAFIFDLDPRPVPEQATQLISIEDSKSTTELLPSELEHDESPAKKVSIGRHTFERAIRSERKRSFSTMAAAAAGLLLVLSALGFGFKDKIFKGDTLVINRDTTIVENGFDPSLIAANNMDKVVLIEFGYKLVHTSSGDDVYHQYLQQEDEKTKKVTEVALYIQTQSGDIEPLLGLKKDVVAGRPIAMSQATGTGFVVDEKGFILTNRHVAASWNSYYSFPQDAYNGILLVEKDGKYEFGGVVQTPPRWVPAETTFFGQKPMSGKAIEGVNTYLDVTFAKNDLRTPAKVVRISNTHDVAMIKVDLPGNLEYTTLKEDNRDIAPGQKIVIMGYPGISPSVVVGKSGNDFANRNTQVLTVPNPTVTDASIGKIIKGSNQTNNSEVSGYFSQMGDYYQLTATATGAGNSGGPVFDKDGNVIAIFSAGATDAQGTRVTFAIPISYGVELMQNKRVIQ